MKDNIHLQSLIDELRKQASVEDVNLWKRIAEDLAKSTRKRSAVNLSKISRYTNENEVVLVPGKVLGSGELNHKLTIIAYKFSEQAKDKIMKAKSSYATIPELVKSNPKGKNVRIII